MQPVDYSHGGVTLLGRLARPAGDGPHPALLVVHDARGLGPGTMRRAEALAAAGYVVLAADMFGEGAYYPDPREAGPAVMALHQDPDTLRGRIGAAFQALRALPGVDAGRIGAVGFCLGGQCVLELARSGADIRAAVSFHGLLATARPARGGEVLAKLLVMTGALDPYAPMGDVEAFRREMVAAGVDHHITIYGEGWHAFTDPEAPTMAHVPGVRHDPLLERLSLAQGREFLDAVVRG